MPSPSRRLLERLVEEYGPAVASKLRGLFDERPNYKVKPGKSGPVVRREGVKPQRVPEARDAKTIDALRVLIRDPQKNPALRAANAESLRVRGRPLSPDEPMPVSSLRRQAGIGRVYQAVADDVPGIKHAIFEGYGNAMPELVEQSGAQNYDQLTEAAYRSLGEDIKRQFDSLPLTLNYHSGSGEYARPSDMFRDVLAKGRLNVFSGGEPHEFLSEIDPQTGLSLNEMFRADHDFYGHVAPGTTFRAPGEEVAYAVHHRTLSPLSRLALLSETRGQNSLVNYSPLNAEVIHKQRALKAELAKAARDSQLSPYAPKPDYAGTNAQLRALAEQYQYAPQKALLLPQEYLDPMSEGGVPDYLRQYIIPEGGSAAERAVHLSHTPGISRTDPTMYGTGHQGVDWTQGGGATGDRVGRTHFYLGPEGTVVPEPAVAEVSPHAYEASLKNLYSIEDDPEGLIKLARAYNLPEFSDTPWGRSAIPDFEMLLRDYNYPGFKSGSRAGVFDPVDVRFRPEMHGPKYAQGGRVSG